MRVIAGKLGGRTFDSPHAARTHPMSDRVRGALFNTLGDVEGLTFLDAFAGTGALSIEALSRGAASALAIESDRPAQRVIDANLRALNLTNRLRLIQANCSGWSDNNPQAVFDIVMADPPFHNLQLPVVRKLARHVSSDGLYVLNWPGKETPPVLENFEQVAHRQYGDTQLTFYRPQPPAAPSGSATD